ncbi:MAG: rod shape-determining protein RodA [Tissierellia bacterium]|nr:rod shape-determining protein RodA [Tissierellia bacterium]
MFNINKKDFKKVDFTLILIVAALCIIGMVVLNSAISPTGDNIKSQIVSTAIGFFSFIVIYFIDFDIFKKLKWLIYAIIIAMLVYTMFFGIGGAQWGADSWVRIGPVTVQPSEFVKVLLVIFLAAFIDDHKKDINSIGFLIKFFILAFIPVAFILRQPDLGTAMVIVFMIAAMFFMSGIKLRTIIIIVSIILIVAILLVLVALPLVWDKLKPYQQNRILDFINPERDVLGSGLQMDRGYTAIGSGQLNGRGYQQGPMSQNNYIPEQHTDYIFPVLVEEFGFIGGIVVLALYFLMIIRMLFISNKGADAFQTTLTVGIAAMFFIHIFENIGMTMRLMPVTGIPLPFFSNGGTFQIVNLVSIGLVLTAGAHRKPLDF